MPPNVFGYLVLIGGLLVLMWISIQPVYTCPQCGSKNGDHSDDCSWG